MKWQEKLYTFIAIIGVIVSSSNVHAQSYNGQSYNGQPQQMNCCPPCADVYLHIDYLCWRPQASNLIYNSDYKAIIERRDQVDITRIDEGGFTGQEVDALINYHANTLQKEKNLNFKWESGIRVGFGYQNPCSCWKIFGDWTHYNTTATGSENPAQKNCADVRLPKTDYEVSSKWNLYLDWFDLSVARTFEMSSCFTITPYAGLRVARIHQKFSSETEGDFLVRFIEEITEDDVERQPLTTNDFLTYEIDVNEKHKFNGVGPRIGFDFDYGLGCGLSLYGDAAVSGIVGYTDHHVCDELTQEALTDDGYRNLSNNRQIIVSDTDIFNRGFQRDEHLQANRWMTDLALGIRWKPNCNFGCFKVAFQFGWEHHAMFNQKHTHYGRDFNVDDLPLVVAGREDHVTPNRQVDPIVNFSGTGRRRATYNGTCRSTLAVQGFVFRANFEF